MPEVCVIAVGNNEHGGGLAVTGDVGAGSGSANYPAIPEIRVRAVGDDECRVPEHVKKNPSANYSAIPEIRVHAVGDDERGGELVVTGDVGTRATAEPVAPLVRSCRR
ncbi:hypothetical protein BKA83DRAFT_4125782 [Pisolithus microcarpus]|nr:hypothetical protein BKA83DRAFT_4125782 [Pisolithus microcarpus]